MTSDWNMIPSCNCSGCREVRSAGETKEAPASEVEEVSTSRLLTQQMVLKGEPCYEYRNRFNQRYGANGVMVTVEKALSESDDWDWEWAGAVLLSRKAKAEFSRRSREADNKYNRTMEPYWDLVNIAYDEYYNVRDQAVIEASTKGLDYNQRYEYVDKASEGILKVPGAASAAAEQIASKRLSDARISAFAELFIADGPAYEEEHRFDIQDDYDENEYQDDDFDENED